jgi:hypothetical protein
MASTQTVRVFSVSQPSVSLRWVEKYFYICRSLLIAAVVVYQRLSRDLWPSLCALDGIRERNFRKSPR